MWEKDPRLGWISYLCLAFLPDFSRVEGSLCMSFKNTRFPECVIKVSEIQAEFYHGCPVVSSDGVTAAGVSADPSPPVLLSVLRVRRQRTKRLLPLYVEETSLCFQRGCSSEFDALQTGIWGSYLYFYSQNRYAFKPMSRPKTV